MNAKELRIGNYVNLEDKGLYKIDCGHDIDEIDSFQLGDPYCSGVPITEEWLLKFGYEYWGLVKENEFEIYKRYVLYNFLGTSNHELHLIDSNYGGVLYSEYVTSIDGFDRQYNGRMEFVHDLQNAVYKETGKELTINK